VFNFLLGFLCHVLLLYGFWSEPWHHGWIVSWLSSVHWWMCKIDLYTTRF
jgi:hypothetical protein